MYKKKKINLKKIVIASDHAGFKLKEVIKKSFFKKKIKFIDLGTQNLSSVDYPHYAHNLSKK